jgi:hypothetical protein
MRMVQSGGALRENAGKAEGEEGNKRETPERMARPGGCCRGYTAGIIQCC